MKIISWNVNGIRAIAKKTFFTDLGKPGGWPEQDKILKDPVLAKAISELEYLTHSDKFIVQRCGNPVLTEIPYGYR